MSLKISATQKLALAGVFMVGIVYGAIEVIRLAVFKSSLASNPYGSPEVTMMYNPLQGCFAVIIGCAPALRPLFFKSGFTRSTGASGADTNNRSNIRPSLAQRSKIRDSWSGDEPDSEEMAILRSQVDDFDDFTDGVGCSSQGSCSERQVGSWGVIGRYERWYRNWFPRFRCCI